jgi:hypothetical protein
VSTFDAQPRVRARPANITRQLLSVIGAHLREEQGALFEPDADIAALEKLEEEPDVAGFGWNRDDAADRFDQGGVLHTALPIYCAPYCRGELQTAFGYFGLVATIPLDADDDEDPIIAPDATTGESDLLAMLRAFDELRGYGVEAEPHFSITKTDGFAELEGNGPAGAIFWHQQSHDAFDAKGNLADELGLYWRGDRDTIATALAHGLASTRLIVHVPTDNMTAFIVSVRPE